MTIRPGLSEVRALAESGEYSVVPISCELLSDFITPIETMRILKNVSAHCYMLESAQQGEKWGRYTFLGYDPKMEITCVNGRLTANHISIEATHPSDVLRQILTDWKSPRMEDLPSFTGGLVGYFSYDYLFYSEPTARRETEDSEGFKDLDLMLFDKVIAFDHMKQKIILIVNMRLSEGETGYNRAALELRQMASLLRTGSKKQETPGRLLGQVTPLFDKARFCGMVEQAKHYIREGDIFQIVLSNRLSAPFEGSLFQTYRLLRTINPSPYMFYFSGTDVEVAGASPETLVKLENGVLHTFPLAGTRPRGKTGSVQWRWRSSTKLCGIPTSCTLAPPCGASSAKTGMRSTPSKRCCPPERSPARRKSAPVSSSVSWKTTSAASTAARSVISTSPATWTPASPSASLTKRMAGSSFAAAQASWRIPCRKRNLRNA